jgi:N-acetylmuramic acid 6-phosphate (MurNAc-6-P) etherase
MQIVTGVAPEDADKLLRKADWNVKVAIVMQKTGLSHAKAMARLRKSKDHVGEAIGEDIEPRLRQLMGE